MCTREALTVLANSAQLQPDNKKQRGKRAVAVERCEVPFPCIDANRRTDVASVRYTLSM